MALCCYSVPSFASETGGKVFLDLQEDTDLEERNFFALYNEFINEVNIFDEKYPQQKIHIINHFNDFFLNIIYIYTTNNR